MSKFPWHFVKFPDNSLTLRNFISPWHFPDGYEPWNGTDCLLKIAVLGKMHFQTNRSGDLISNLVDTFIMVLHRHDKLLVLLHWLVEQFSHICRQPLIGMSCSCFIESQWGTWIHWRIVEFMVVGTEISPYIIVPMAARQHWWMWLTHWGREQWTPFSRRHFQMHFLQRKCMNCY